MSNCKQCGNNCKKSSTFACAEDFLVMISNALVYGFLYIFNPRHTWDEVKHRKIHPSREVKRLTPSNTAIGSISVEKERLELFKSYYDNEEDRRTRIDNKARHMINFASILFVTIGFAQNLVFSHDGISFLLLAAFMFNCISLYMLFVNHMIQITHCVDYVRLSDLLSSSITTDLPISQVSPEFYKEYANEFFVAGQHNSLKNDYQCGIYRVSSRCFDFAFFLVIIRLIWFALSSY